MLWDIRTENTSALREGCAAERQVMEELSHIPKEMLACQPKHYCLGTEMTPKLSVTEGKWTSQGRGAGVPQGEEPARASAWEGAVVRQRIR